jgi:cation diffusion facilitator family transporter
MSVHNPHEASLTHLDGQEQERLRQIAAVAWLSIVGNLFLSAAKIFIGWKAGSWAVVGDGIDSFGDILSSLLTLITSHIISRPPDGRFPWGRQRADTVATKLLSFVIFFFGAQLSYSSFLSLIHHDLRPIPDASAFVITAISIAMKILLSLALFRTGKITGSAMLVANAKNMRNDVIISVVVLLGLVFTWILGVGTVDLIFAFLVGLWIMRTAVEVFMETNTELMDGMDDKTVYYQVFDATEAVPGAKNPHRARVRKFANYYLIDLDIEVDPALTVAEAHQISQNVEDAIKRRVKNVYDIMIHIEPEGNVERSERYGLTRSQL